MTIELLTRFLMWCTIINAGLLALLFLMCAYGADFVYRIHSRWFPMKRETFTVVLYTMFGLYKLLFYFFNLVPYVALLLLGR